MESLAQPLELRNVGEIVAEDYRRAPVLKRHGIDFCCGGGVTLAAAAAKAGVPVAQLTSEIAAAAGAGPAPARVDSWDAGFLADYIVNQHHAYVREQTPALLAFTEKVARVHGGNHPELIEIAGLFADVASEMEEHMAKEEAQIFPRIRALGAGAADDGLRAAIAELEDEHEGAGALMREIRRLSDGYAPPAGACNTYRAAFANLEAFEEDLHRHVHLENNVLFPKVLAPEPAAAACACALPARPAA